MTMDLGNITLIPGQINTFRTASTGLEGILIGNESGFTCSVQLGISSPRTIKPGTQDFFPVDSSYNGIIIINPKSVLSTANLYPSNLMYFEAVGYREGFDPSGYPMALPRNTTGQFAGTQFAYLASTFQTNFVPGNTVLVFPPIAANTTTRSLTFYGSNNLALQASATIADMAVQTGGTEVSATTKPASSTTGWIEVVSLGTTSGTVNANIPAQDGLGWLGIEFPFGATGFLAGNWSATIGVTYGTTITADATLRIGTYNTDTQTFTTIGTIVVNNNSLSTTRTNIVFPATAMPAISLPNNTYMYFDLFLKGHTSWNTADLITVFEGQASKGVANDVQITPPANSLIIPTAGSLTNGNSLYTAQMSTYFGGIDVQTIEAGAQTQVNISVLNLDPTLFQINAGVQIGWNTSVAQGGNVAQYQRFFANPFKSATGQQLQVNVFQDTGVNFITGQVYYYVQ